MRIKILKYSLLLFFIFGIFDSFSQNDSSKVIKFIKKTDFSGQWFLANQYDLTDNLNKFYLKRAYLTIKTKLSKKLSVRYTQDITLDKEGSDAGNVEIRMKYLFMKVKPFTRGFLKNLYGEFGLIPRPWLEFEQKINPYRSKGKMYIEKVEIINSADFGIMLSGLIGEKLNKNNRKKNENHHYGKYGSYSLGIYNGAGYHDYEYNNNKTIEGRISLRPFPEIIPGLQFTYSGAFGKANLEDEAPNFNLNLFYMSLENPSFTLTGQYYIGEGDTYGKYYYLEESFTTNMYARKNSGYSIFGEFKIPKTPLYLFSRYDSFTSDYKHIDTIKKTGYFAGITYRFMKNKLFAYYGKDIINGDPNDVIELVLEVVF